MIKLSQPRAIAGALAAACLCVQSSNAQTPAAPAAADKPVAAAAEKPAAAPADQLFPDTVVAKGKGIEIKRSKLDESLIALRAEAAARGQSIPEDMRSSLEADVLHGLIFKDILATKATAEDKAKAKETTDQYLADVRKKFPTEDEFQSKLKAAGMTLEQLQSRRLEEAVCMAVLDRELKSKITITDADIKKFYDENPQEFEQPEQVRASHILISTLDKAQQPLPAEQKKLKEKLARDIKARADKGEDFAKLAKEFSEDPGSKDNGGEYTFPRGQMVKEFEAAAFSLKTNQVSDLVETQYGYHIIKLSEKIPASKVDLAKVSPKIKDFLTDQEVRKQLPDYRSKLEKEAGVELIGIKDPPKATVADAASDTKPADTNAPAADKPASTNAPAVK